MSDGFPLVERDEREDGTVVSIYYDTEHDLTNPRENQDNLGTILYFGDRHTLGDEQVSLAHYDYEAGVAEYAQELIETSNAAIVIPLRFTEGSGGAHVFAADDFTNANGLIWLSEDKLRAEYIEFGYPDMEAREKARKSLEAEISEYDAWLSGDVYGYHVEHPDFPDLADSCWGFIGDLNYVRSEAEAAAEHVSAQVAERVAKENAERAEWEARDVMTVGGAF